MVALAAIMLTEGREGTCPELVQIEKLLSSHFLSSDYEQMLYCQYQQCAQGVKIVSPYTKEFFHLSAQNNLIETVNQLVSCYIGGLKILIKDKLELNDVWTMTQAVNLGLKVKIQLNRSPRYASQ